MVSMEQLPRLLTAPEVAELLGVNQGRVHVKDNEVKRIIRRRFKTESACAEAMGWSKQKLNKYTTGKSEMNIRALQELCQALGADTCRDVDELVAALMTVSAWRRGQEKQGG